MPLKETHPNLNPVRPIEGFLNAWSIFRRNLSTYPSGHPILKQSGQRTAAHLQDLQAQGNGVDLGILKDRLLVNGESLGEGNPKIARFAENLYRIGVAGIQLRPGIAWEELARFSQLLDQSREDLDQNGGLGACFRQLNLPHIRLTEVDYSQIRTTEEKRIVPSDEEQPKDLWELFIAGLLQATPGTGGRNPATEDLLAPKALAAYLNQMLVPAGRPLAPTAASHLAQPFGGLLRHSHTTEPADPARQQLLTFVRYLHPEIRRQFLEGGLRILEDETEAVESLLKDLPASTLAEMLHAQEQLEAGKEPPLLKILQRLLGGTPARVRPQALDTDSAAVEALHTLFREDTSELYLAGDYLKQLNKVIRLDQVPANTTDEIQTLMDSLETQRIESKICAVILEVAQGLPPEDQANLLSRNLLDISTYFLELGDFPALVNLYDRLQADARSADTHVREIVDQALKSFHQPSFIQEVLESLHLWGKPKYPEVQAFIRRIGMPFIDPLLDALADEESMSLRRYYMECILRMGAAIRPYLAMRIEDDRWYFVRNLVVLLRQLDDPAVLPSLEGLLGHPHLRVRQEVIRTFLQFRDNRAVKPLLLELESNDPEVLLTAIRLAEKGHSPVILRKLMAQLSTRDLSEEGLKIQCALVRALGEIGAPEALPELRKLLRYRSLFNVKAQATLKAEIARSLGRYPAHAVQGLLNDLSASRTAGVAHAAKEGLTLLQRRGS